MAKDRGDINEGGGPSEGGSTEGRGRSTRGTAGRGGQAGLSEDEASRAALPEILRRAMALGLSGFFSTEEAIRKALGDTLPKDWVDFASLQSERTRDEMLDRLAAEFGRVMDSVDIVDVLSKLLEGHTLEVKAEVKLTPRADGASGRPTQTNLQVAGTRKKDSS